VFKTDTCHYCETDIWLEILIPFLGILTCFAVVKGNGMNWKLSSTTYEIEQAEI
jgi:hypothetical protein